MAFVLDRDADLTLECHALIEHLDGERLFIRALAEAGAESPMQLDRQPSLLRALRAAVA